MKRFLFIVVGALVAGVVIVGSWRMWNARKFSVPQSVQTLDGTNYIFQLNDVTLGRVDTGFVVIVAARLENPNYFPVELQRECFVLVDSHQNYYRPSTNGTQTIRLTIPGNGVLERELFSYQVPRDGLDGMLGILAGDEHWVTVKNSRRYVPVLRDGEFVIRRRVDW